MSKPDPKNPSTSDQFPKSENPLEIVSIGINESQENSQNPQGLSQDKLNQIAEQINANLQENKTPNWQIETNLNETKVKVNLD
jgi:uncharacterized FlaG/YvyC family protein